MRVRSYPAAVLIVFFLFTVSCSRFFPPWEKQGEEAGTGPPSQPPARIEPAPPDPPEPAPSVPQMKQEDILVRIGNREISRSGFEKRYREYLLLKETEKGEILSPGEYLDVLILRELVAEYAEKEELDREPAFLALLDREREKILIDYILQNRFTNRIKVGDEELEWYYREKISDFTRPGKIQVRHILASTVEEAKEALRRLESGEDFGSVAREFSIHASRALGGQLPSFSRGTYNRIFEEAAFPLEVGELSPIVRTELGYHIIEKTGETPETIQPFEEVKEQIRERIVQEKRKQALKDFHENIRRDIDVEILEEP